MPITMRLLIVLLILKVTSGESREVTGYIGESATLLSGADPNRTLSTINWSIYTNNTYIATLSKGTIQLEWFGRYIGRLSLNNSSGDLTIRNLTSKDAMQYSVDLTDTKRHNSAHKIDLKVKQRLQKPTIDTASLPAAAGSCWWRLNCSSTEKVNNLFWHDETFISETHPKGSSAVLLAFLESTEMQAEFRCTSIRNRENASNVVTLKCDDKPKHRNHYMLLFFVGYLLGVFLTLCLVSIGEKSTTA
ncbi:uncharacterized protein [Notothenia coriiceps]|uniref:Uncharacterized protein LOC104965863 n=1 Tax=Notothenia coriiceps TaxID=8208 RepID=A0A6I9PQA0_9TELE|nr:PREDICTED: uncharacterized protein LOC104965863 [Notothenia coriiceps]XP_010793200.1 PREDICTED: uncharacterized protein LOC104965863 [Notothenia coriiceps]